jgi:uncharacterized membrane-anchored protein YhcB (DUF1043 family)
MNKELYNKIKAELDNLDGEYAKPKYVCEKLIGQRLLGKNLKDQFTVIYAFYQYMKNKEDFSFIKEGTWNKFYQRNFSKYLTKDVIKREFDEIVSDDMLVDTILSVCDDDVKMNLYEYAKMENYVFENVGNKKYNEVFKRIEDNMVEQGLVKKQEENVNEPGSLNNDENINRRQTTNEGTQFESKDMFTSAAKTLGIDKGKLIKKADKLLEKEEKDIRSLDKIVIEPSVMEMLSGDASKAATMEKTTYQKFKERVRARTVLHKLNLDIVSLDGKATLVIKKKESFSDKIASSDNAMVRAIGNSAREKLKLFKQLVKPSAEVTSLIKQGLANTSNKFTESVYNTKQEVKAAYGELKDNLTSSFQESINSVKQDFEDAKDLITHYSDSARDKISSKLYNMADRISPNVNTEENIEKPVERVTYAKGPNGRKIVVRAGTKAGEIHKQTHTKAA